MPGHVTGYIVFQSVRCTRTYQRGTRPSEIGAAYTFDLCHVLPDVWNTRQLLFVYNVNKKGVSKFHTFLNKNLNVNSFFLFIIRCRMREVTARFPLVNGIGGAVLRNEAGMVPVLGIGIELL